MVTLVGLNPEFRARYDLAMRELGDRAYLRSGVRSRAEQVELRRRYLLGIGELAAIPGTSNHERGLAVDVNPTAKGSFAEIHRVFVKYGFHFPIPGEAWHAELDPHRKPLSFITPQPVKVTTMPEVVAVCSNTRHPAGKDMGGYWVLTEDGGIENRGGAPFFGSYPGFPPEVRNAPRSFVSIEELRDRPGYRIFGKDRSYYTFDEKVWADIQAWHAAHPNG